MNARTLVAAVSLVSVPVAALATSTHPRVAVRRPAASSSCSVSSNQSPSFGTLTNPIASLQHTIGSVLIGCSQGSGAFTLAFNDAANSGTFNFTLTNTTTSSATQAFQICDYEQFTGTACPSGYEYKNTASDAHAQPAAQVTNYEYVVYFNPPPGGVNLTNGAYLDTLTETISF